MMTNFRILDCDLQLCRNFTTLIPEYDTIQKPSGVYDLLFTHRETMQDRFDSVKQYIKPSTKIITDISTESGNIDDFLIPYKKIVKSEPYQFYLISDAPIPNKEEYGDNVKILDSYNIVFYAHLNLNSDNFHMTEKFNIEYGSVHDGFLSLNNSCRLHRVYLLTQLLKRNFCLDNCSFLFSTGTPNGWKYNEEITKNSLDYFLERGIIDEELYKTTLSYPLPKTLDYDNNDAIFIYNHINELYKLILNLVTENVTGITEGDISKDKIYTFTEKSIKPFIAKQIPVFFGLPGHVELLRSLGFDMYDDIVDHSYDKEENHFKRMDMLLDEVDRLVKIDLLNFKNNNLARFENNRLLLDKLTKLGEEEIKSFLYEEILK